MTSGIRDLSFTFISKIICLLLIIGMQSCLAWCLGPAGRGSYAVCLMFATLLSVILVVGCDTASVFFVSSRRFDISEGITYSLIYGGIGSALAIVAGLILMQFKIPFFEKASPAAFYLGLATIPTLLFSTIFVRLLTSIHQFGWFAIMSVACELYRLLFIIIFIWILPWGVKGALFGNFVGGAVAIFSTLILFRWKCGATLVKPSIRNLQEMFHYGVRYYAGKISNLMNFQMGTIILALFATKDEIGLFAVASQVTSKAMMIPDSLTAVLIPKAAADKTGKGELIAQCSRLTILICGVLLLILAVFAKPIVRLLFSPDFLPAVSLIRILTVGVVVRCGCKVFVPYLLGTNHPGIASISVATGMFVNLAILWLLLPVIGLPGAALGVIGSYFVSSAILTFGFSRYSGIKIRQIWKFNSSDLAIVRNSIKSIYRKFVPEQTV